MGATKHLIQCHCILPQYRGKKDPVFHKFTAFSLIDDESDTVEMHYANCNTTGAVHKIYDICKSEIVVGSEDAKSQIMIEDFKLSLHGDLYETFINYNCEVVDFQFAQYIIDSKLWGSHIVLSREELDEKVQGKIIKFIEENKFRIESYVHKESVS